MDGILQIIIGFPHFSSDSWCSNMSIHSVQFDRRVFLYDDERRYECDAESGTITIRISANHEENRNKWYGTEVNYAILNHVIELKGYAFLYKTVYETLPPRWMIAPLICSSNDLLVIVQYQAPERFYQRNTIHLHESIRQELTWNAFRFYTEDDLLLVDIALGYNRNHFTTMEASVFMQYRVYEYELFYIDGRVCFACDWEYAEDHPVQPFRQWTVYDHYHESTHTWQYNIKSRHYSNVVYDASAYIKHYQNEHRDTSNVDCDSYHILPPIPDVRLLTWIQLHCLVLQITYESLNTASVSYLDHNGKNLKQTNLKQISSRPNKIGTYIRHYCKDVKRHMNTYTVYNMNQTIEKTHAYSFRVKDGESFSLERERIREKRVQARYQAMMYCIAHNPRSSLDSNVVMVATSTFPRLNSDAIKNVKKRTMDQVLTSTTTTMRMIQE